VSSCRAAIYQKHSVLFDKILMACLVLAFLKRIFSSSTLLDKEEVDVFFYLIQNNSVINKEGSTKNFY